MMTAGQIDEMISSPVPIVARGYDRRWGHYRIYNTAMIRQLIANPVGWRRLVDARFAKGEIE